MMALSNNNFKDDFERNRQSIDPTHNDDNQQNSDTPIDSNEHDETNNQEPKTGATHFPPRGSQRRRRRRRETAKHQSNEEELHTDKQDVEDKR